MTRTIALGLLALAAVGESVTVSGESPYGIGLYPPTRTRSRANRYRPDPYRVDPYRIDPYRRNPYDLTELYASGTRPFRPGPYGYAAYRARSGRNDGYMARAPWPGYSPRDAVLRRQVPSYSDFHGPDYFKPWTARPPRRSPYAARPLPLPPAPWRTRVRVDLYDLPAPTGCVGGCCLPSPCGPCGGTIAVPGGAVYLGF